ncbi:MAG: pyridoxine 5'-phosphate synthase [Thermogutta sp.]
MIHLGVNVDHIATLRQARRTYEPDPVWGAALAELGGADGITIHLREDRRHIQDRDLRLLRETTAVKLNLEMACSEEITEIALAVKPDQATLVPERREEITTEGGLDVAGQLAKVTNYVKRLQDAGITVSLFVDPDPIQIDAALKTGAIAVELHTGRYANSSGEEQRRELDVLRTVSREVLDRGLKLHAGHGLTYHNVQPVAAIPGMAELNIGHSIISRAVLVGMVQAVREMKELMIWAASHREIFA